MQAEGAGFKSSRVHVTTEENMSDVTVDLAEAEARFRGSAAAGQVDAFLADPSAGVERQRPLRSGDLAGRLVFAYDDGLTRELSLVEEEDIRRAFAALAKVSGVEVQRHRRSVVYYGDGSTRQLEDDEWRELAELPLDAEVDIQEAFEEMAEEKADDAPWRAAKALQVAVLPEIMDARKRLLLAAEARLELVRKHQQPDDGDFIVVDEELKLAKAYQDLADAWGRFSNGY